MVTRATPRHDYARISLEHSTGVLSPAQQVRSYAKTLVDGSHNFRNETFEDLTGLATQFPARSFSPRARRASLPLAKAGDGVEPGDIDRQALYDIEFEDEDEVRRLVSVRPWLSSALGCDSADEDEHQNLIDETLLSRTYNLADSFYFVLPDFDSPVVTKARNRLQSFLTRHPREAWHITDAKRVADVQFWYRVNPATNRLEAYDPESLRRVTFVMPIAVADVSRWPEPIKECFRSQDAEKNALLAKITEIDNAEIGTVWEPDSISEQGRQIIIGRKSAIVSRIQPQEAIDALVESLSSGGLIRVRQRGTDKALVLDYQHDSEVFHFMLEGAGDRGMVIEEPPFELAQAYASFEQYHVQTQTFVLPPQPTEPSSARAHQLNEATYHSFSATFAPARLALPLVEALSNFKMQFNFELSCQGTGEVQWLQTDHDDKEIARLADQASRISVSECKTLVGADAVGQNADVAVKFDIACAMQQGVDIRFTGLEVANRYAHQIATGDAGHDFDQLKLVRDAFRKFFIGQGRELWDDFLKTHPWWALVDADTPDRRKIQSAAQLIGRFTQILGILREAGCEQNEVGGAIYRLLDMLVAKHGESTRNDQ